MDITPLVPQGRQFIQAYEPSFHVSGVSYESAICVKPSATSAWNVDGLEILDVQTIADLAEGQRIVLFGTGAKGIFPAKDIRLALKSKGLVCEFMTTPAACRTYNVLMTEGRDVVAFLLPLTAQAD